MIEHRSPREHIEATTNDLIDLYRTKPASHGLFRSVRSMIEKTAQEYTGRSLIELVQNGHDAMAPNARSGRIHLLLDPDEGEHGVAYVANTGRPFTPANFDAIVNLAQSDKRADQGIGNKGIGFKSVLNLSDAPEVYSSSPGGSADFDGYSFRFASVDDVRPFVGGERREAQKILRDIASLALPVPIESRPGRLDDFPSGSDIHSSQRFVTVVRLPLRDGTALAAARQQLHELAESESPVLLFLDRIDQLIIEQAGSPPMVLERKVQRLTPETKAGPIIETVDLGDTGRFLLARRRLDKRKLREAIAASVTARQVDESWADWDGDAWVGVAVGRDDPVEGRYYAFLPMGGGAQAPFAGHVNAPFFTRLARLDLDTDVPLNSFLMDEVARLAANAIRWLCDEQPDGADNAIVDLLCWQYNHLPRLRAAFGDGEKALHRAPVVPTASSGARHFAPLRRVHRWSSDHEVLTFEALTRHCGADLIAVDDLGEERVDRLEQLAIDVQERTLDAEADTIGHWAERLARWLHRQAASPETWGLFYDELSDVMRPATALSGRVVLLDDSGKVRPAVIHERSNKSTDRLFFFHPARRDEIDDADGGEVFVDLKVPERLRRRIGFMAADLDWAPAVGGTRRLRRGRAFLANAGFVREFRVDRVLTLLRQVVAGTKSDKLRQDALVFAFDLWRRARARDGLDLAGLGLWVPVVDGTWVAADQAHFSGAWSKLGERLEHLIQRAGPVSDELLQIGDRLIAAPDDWPAAVTDRDLWKEFLSRLGVNDGLVPRAVGPAKLVKPHYWLKHPGALAKQIGLNDDAAQFWADAVQAGGGPLGYGWWQTDYHLDQPIFVVPGQADFDHFPATVKRLYSRLIAAGLSAWPERAFYTSFTKPARPSHTVRWPSPLAAFLGRAAWVPVSSPLTRGEEHYATPGVAWHHRGDAPPNYATLVVKEVRSLLEASDRSAARVLDLGFNIWDAPEDGPALIAELGRLLASGTIVPTAMAALRNDYRGLWTQVVRRSLPSPFQEGELDQYLVVDAGGAVEAVKVAADDGEPVFVPDIDERTRLSLLTALRRHVVPVTDDVGAPVAALLRPQLGQRVVRVSDIQLEVLADGNRVVPSVDGPLLFAPEHVWIPELVGLVLYLRSGQFRHTGQDAINAGVDRSGRIRAVPSRSISVRLDGEDVQLHPPLDRSVSLPDPAHPTLVTTLPIAPLTWTTLIALSASIAELVGRPDLADPLELTLRKLSESEGAANRPERPSPEQLAVALGVSREQVVSTLTGIRGQARQLLDQVRPVVAYLADDKGLAELDKLPDDADRNEVLLVATELLEGKTADPSLVLEMAAEGGPMHQLVERLSFDFRRFNAVLARLGYPYEPIANARGQRDEFSTFTKRCENEVLDRIRAAYAPSAGELTPKAGYLDARASTHLDPDPGWIETCYLPTDDAMRAYVDRWLKSHDAVGLADRAEPLFEPVETVRRQNRVLLGALGARVGQSVRAWCAGKNLVVPSPWDAGDPATALVELAHTSGISDFIELDEADVVRWLTQQGYVPAGWSLEATLPPGPPPEPPPKPEGPKIKIGGREFDATPGQYEAIGHEIDKGLEEGLSKAFRSTSPEPAELPPGPPIGAPGGDDSGGGRGGGGGGGSSGRETSESTSWAIGYAGEHAAYRWLCEQYGEAAVHWRSSYRDHFFGGADGDNALGYDFDVAYADDLLLVEVKATTGAGSEFELTPGEVACARAHRDDDLYRILVISYVLDPKRIKPQVLPNPFGRQGCGFTVLDGSVRFAYSPLGDATKSADPA